MNALLDLGSGCEPWSRFLSHPRSLHDAVLQVAYGRPYRTVPYTLDMFAYLYELLPVPVPILPQIGQRPRTAGDKFRAT